MCSKRVERLKRALDVAISACLLLTLAPAMLLLSTILTLLYRSSPIYRQARLGRDGAPFVIYKFRTLHSRGTDEVGARLRHSLENRWNVNDGDRESNAYQDPSVTRLGSLLRRYHIDELPQLFNVLRGDMSLVGPRPFTLELFEHPRSTTKDFHLWVETRQLVRPGMSGLWQVSGPDELPPSELIRLDRYYVEHWSFLMDLLILVRTPLAVLSRRGAFRPQIESR